ncbi:MAG: GTPase Era [Nitrosomonas sp.]|nr:MAG: GTPase Era [Nitrosomonas sp.]
MHHVNDFRAGYVAIIGRPNVGKSTLLNQLLQQKISITSRKAQTTRYRIHGIVSEPQVQFVFVDTPGFQTQYTSRLNMAMNRVVTQSVHDVHVILFVIEAMRFDQRDLSVLKILPPDMPVILVINKVDKLADKNQLLPFTNEVVKNFPFAAIVPVSATRKIQLIELLNTVRDFLPVNAPLYHEDQITDRSERFMAAEFIREKLFRLIGDEIPYSTSVVIDQFQQEAHVCKIYATILVEKANQKAIVIGNKGERLKQIASEARLDMEKLFDTKVYLEVWVKVKSGWADNEQVLKNLGFE